MAHVDGYRLKLPDGTSAEVIPHGPRTEVVIGALSMTITTIDSKTSISVSFELDDKDVEIPVVSVGKASLQKPSNVMASKREVTASGASRQCIVCNGRRICVSNGCINTPCGSICST